MTDVRRFDFLERVVADRGRQLDDLIATVLGRFGAHRPLPVVEYTTEIAYPYAEQVVINITDRMLYRYTGSAWEAFLALGGTTAATRHECRYNQNANQNLNNVTDTKIQFQSAALTCNDVVVSGTGNTDFTVGRSGLWRINTCLTLLGGANGSRHVNLQLGSTIDFTKWFSRGTNTNVGGSLASIVVSSDIRLVAGNVICVIGWQDSGGVLSTDTFFGTSNHISLTWLRP